MEWDRRIGGAGDDHVSQVISMSDDHYIIAGSTESYGEGGDVWLLKAAGVQWNKSIPGPRIRSVDQTSDGGYILTGTVWQGVAQDVWLAKTDAAGDMQWSKSFGGENNDYAYSVRQTSDGGHIIAGSANYRGEYPRHPEEMWLIKTDADGEMEWNRIFGRGRALGVQQTNDGGYIACGGQSYQYMWLVKTDANGVTQWERTFGAGHEQGYAVQQTKDDGYIITGYTTSYGAGQEDIWLVKTDANGNKQWDKTFGRTQTEIGYSVQQTSDGGYIVGGRTESYEFDEYDLWLVKTDADGNKQWDKTFGGTLDDRCAYIPDQRAQQTADGGYMLTGVTESFATGPYGSYSLWLVKTDPNGNKQWDQTVDGGRAPHSGLQTSDGGFVVAGSGKLVKIAGPNSIYYRDSDGDNYGDTSDFLYLEEPSYPYTAILDGDCDDSDPYVYPGAAEVMCNGKDDDCNAATPEDENIDGDPASLCQGDCDDNDPGRYPGNPEVFCNDIDDDCSTATTDSPDADGDHFSVCDGDCDDNDPEVNPGVAEIACNGKDDDCRPATPDDPNADGDPVSLCAGDCDDNDPTIYPGAPEICDDAIDNDCDLLVDGDDPDCSGIAGIGCVYPPNQATIFSPPTFMWTANGGANNRFAVDLSYDWTFSWYWSTYENMHQPISAESWVMPQPMWNFIPSGSYVYWRVRGADLDVTPLTIITGGDVWWFYKQ
jgi:hypothetical protein